MAIKVKKGTQITFEAKDDAEALRVARSRLGADAAVLSSRPVKIGGFFGMFRRNALEVTAAVLEEERRDRETDIEKKERLAAFQKLLEIKQAMSSSDGVTGGESTLLENARGHGPSVASAGVYSPLSSRPSKDVSPPEPTLDVVDFSPRALALSADKKVSEMTVPESVTSPLVHETSPSEKLQKEVNEIARRLDQVLKRLETEHSGQTPVIPRAEEGDLVERLLAADVSEIHARSLVERFRADQDNENFVRWLGNRIPVSAKESWDALGGRKVMLIGPTGVGKTTTIAKLAAIHSLWKKKSVFLLTADTYRIAAREQIRTYAKILGIPMDVVEETDQMPSIMEKINGTDLILLDTAGRSQRDSRRIEEMRALYEVFCPDSVHLVLSANMKYHDMLDVINNMGVVPISRIIFTKLDETTTYGALLNTLLDFDRPASFFTTGQNVPNDIEVASGARLAELLMNGKGGAAGE